MPITNDVHFDVILGDITTINSDVIVNAANSSLLGGGGVDGAIHRKGGADILAQCQQIRAKQGGCATGQAVITTAGNLPSRFVVHTVGPIWRRGNQQESELLASCYRECLKLAIQAQAQSIAFPNISTGVYRFPKDLACQIALNSVITFCEQNNTKPLATITFVCFDNANFDLYQAELGRYNG